MTKVYFSLSLMLVLRLGYFSKYSLGNLTHNDSPTFQGSLHFPMELFDINQAKWKESERSRVRDFSVPGQEWAHMTSANILLPNTQIHEHTGKAGWNQGLAAGTGGRGDELVDQQLVSAPGSWNESPCFFSSDIFGSKRVGEMLANVISPSL